MCNPVLIVMAAAVAVSAYSAYGQQKAANQAADYEGKIAEQNAKNSELLAQESEKQGERDAAQRGKDMGAVKGAQRSAFASSGVDISEGTAADVVTNTAAQGHLDALTLKHNAAKDAWGYRAQGVNYQAQGNLAKMSMRNPWETGGMTALTQGSSYAASYYGSKAGASGKK